MQGRRVPSGSHLMTWFRPLQPVVLIFGVAVAAMPACRDEPPAAQERPSGGVIAFVGVGQDDPLWPWLKAAAARAAEHLEPFNLRVRSAAPESSGAEHQIELVRGLTREGIRGLCVQVADAETLAAELQSLRLHGVRVVTLMRFMPPDSGLMHVGLDEEAIGRATAKAIAAAVDGAGQIAVLHADSASPESARRHRAFRSQLEAYPGVRAILAFDCAGEPTTAEGIIRDAMARYPKLAGWAVLGSWPLRSDVAAAPLVPEGCRLVAADPRPDCRGRILDGSVHALVVPRYDRLVELAVTACAEAVLGASAAPDVISVPVETVPAGEWGAFEGRMMQRDSGR